MLSHGKCIPLVLASIIPWMIMLPFNDGVFISIRDFKGICVDFSLLLNWLEYFFNGVMIVVKTKTMLFMWRYLTTKYFISNHGALLKFWICLQLGNYLIQIFFYIERISNSFLWKSYLFSWSWLVRSSSIFLADLLFDFSYTNNGIFKLFMVLMYLFQFLY